MGQVPVLGAVFVAGGVGDADLAVVQEFGEEDKVAVLGEGAFAHQGDQDMAGGQEGGYVLVGAVGDSLYLEAVGGEGVGDEAVVGAAVEGVAAVFQGPVGEGDGACGGVGEAVDDHGDGGGTAAVFVHGVFAAVEIVSPAQVALMEVEHGSAAGV